MKELIVLSGKGGAGKTSLCAAFACLAKDAVLADCDVDAADLHILLEPFVEWEEPFSGGLEARIREDQCIQCGDCREACRFGAITEDFHVDPVSCEGCGVCSWVCPVEAVELTVRQSGILYVSRTRVGPMVHARLGIAEENSGKLVAEVRRRARAVAEEAGRTLILADGPPGLGCPVISSVTGADGVILVAEPTVSGFHDLARLAELVQDHFHIPTLAVINKWDLHEELTRRMETFCAERNILMAGHIPYDLVMVKSMIQKKTVVEYGEGPVVQEIRNIWHRVESWMSLGNGGQDDSSPMRKGIP